MCQSSEPTSSAASDARVHLPDGMQAAATRFVIVSPGRAGSTLLRMLLNEHPQVRCHGEVLARFHVIGFIQPRDENGNGMFAQSLRARIGACWAALTSEDAQSRTTWRQDRPRFLMQLALTKRRMLHHLRRGMPEIVRRRSQNAVGFLQEMIFSVTPKEHAAGFKLLYSHAGDLQFAHAMQWMADEQDIVVIYLRRENMLKRFISRQAFFAGTRTKMKGSRVGKPRPVVIDPDEFLEDVRNHEASLSQLREHFAGHRSVEVSYEDLVNARDETMTSLFKTLGVEPLPVEPRTVKVNKDNLRESILNYDDLCKRDDMRPYLPQGQSSSMND